MKTKKQLAAAAAAAAAAADKKAAESSSTVTTPSSTKKPVKRLQSKAKDSSPKLGPHEKLACLASTGVPPQGTSPKPNTVVNPKPLSPAKHESTVPSSSKNVKTAPSSAPTIASGPCGSKKPDIAKVKKSSPAIGAKKPGGGGGLAGEKKKIQKELKNLGITDKTINQIDAATVECNPSISEMVKTKSRATVSQQKNADFGALGGHSAVPKTVASKQEASIEIPKLLEPVVTTPTKKKPVQKTKDSKQNVSPAREEGVKNKTPIAAQLPPSSSAPTPTPSHASVVPKEDVKAPNSIKNMDSKSKAKKPESKLDNNAANNVVSTGDQQQQQQQQQKAAKKSSAIVLKPKPKSKKAILVEKRAAEEKAAAELAATEAAAAVVAKQEAENKQRIEEDRTCSLELVESDDKNDEEEVQSRIEDIVKSLEDDDDDEQLGMGMRLEGLRIESNVGKEELNVKKKSSTKVIKSKTETDKKLKKPELLQSDETGHPTQSSTSSMLLIDSTDSSINADNLKSTTKRKYTKPKTPIEKSKKPSLKNKSNLSKPGTDSPCSNSESLEKVSAPPKPAAIFPTDEVAKYTSDLKALEANESPETPKSIRSSTENDDDLPLNRLKDQSKVQHAQSDTFIEPPMPSASAKSGSITSSVAPVIVKAASKTKRKYVRKPQTTAGSKKPTKAPATTVQCTDSKEKKPLEKKDVYDFDESESESDSPAKPPVKPIFKRKQLEASATKDEIEPESDLTSIEELVQSEKSVVLQAIGGSIELSECDSIKDEHEVKKVIKKSEVKSETKTHAQPKDSEADSDSDQEKEGNSKTHSKAAIAKKPRTDSESQQSDDDKEKDPDERPATPVNKKIKKEVRESSDEESGGYTSEESVRTRIVKKQLTAKTRHLKLYGFWSGPKRHRVASLNAIAKVHCLYENETRAALEASLMKQSSSTRAPKVKEVKKEKAEEESKKGDSERGDEKKKGDEVIKKVEEEKVTVVEEKKSKDEEKKQKEEKKHKEDEKKKTQKTASVKQEKKKAVKKVEPKEDKKREVKKVEVKEEKKESKKKEKEKMHEGTGSDSDSDESEEEVVTRTLRCVPGLRGAGKHWDPDASSMESGADDLADSDETYTQGKDTDPVKKRKIKRKVIKKPKPKPKVEKSDKTKPPPKKIKKEIKALLSDAEKQQKLEEDDETSSSSASSDKAPTKSKSEETKKRKREPKEKKEVVEVLGKKRMASLNATAMLAATYEVQRILYRNTDSDSDSPAEKPKSKKAKEHKDAKEKSEPAKTEEKKAQSKTTTKETKKDEEPGCSTKSNDKDKPKEKEKDKDNGKEPEKENEVEQLVMIKTEPIRDRPIETAEVKREIEEPRPVSNNVVIAQDTEVTITGVYVNSGLGSSQEAYCKMQYRVQQSVTEERLVRPGEAPPKSYTPLTALSSMRPPNDQASQLATPPLFGQPAQCDSPLGLGGPPRGFYPPPTSSSGSSSAFCAPIPHDSPGYYQPAGPLISPHLLAQAPPSSSSQHSASSSTITKQPPESDSPVQSLTQPPSSSTADSTDSDVLLTGGDLSSRSQSYGRYGPSGPPNLYSRPVQMHCPPPHLAPNYYAAPPYSQYPPEMYYAHAYPPAHFYPKFAQYYPTSRRYYPGHPGPGDHLYEQSPPPTSGPLPPPSGAQLVPAGPQGPQHLEHYPGPPPYPYPGYGSPGPGPGGQCYSRNLQPPPYMDAHYTTNCPCPMQSCPKNVNAGSLIGIKASKGPVASTTNQNSQHIANTTGIYPTVSQTMNNHHHEPILISSGSSTSSSPAPLDLHSPPIIHAAEAAITSSYSTPTTTTITTTTMASNTSINTSAMTTVSTTTAPTAIIPAEPMIAHQVKPESDLHPYSYHHYHHLHRPSAPPPTHPLHHYHTSAVPLLAEVKEEPCTPTLESESKSINNIPKLLPLKTVAANAIIKQELTEVKLEPPMTLSCKKEDFEENGPAMTPDLLIDEALIKKEGLVSELCFKETQKLDDKSILNNILTAEANLKTSKTTDSDSYNINNSNNNSVSTNNSSISNEKVQLVDSVLPEIPASTVKRRPLLVACKKSTPKKSPPNSYKNLIKRTNVDEESTITVLSDDDEEDEDEEDEERLTKKKLKPRKLLLSKPRKVLKRTRRVFGAEQLHHLKKKNKKFFKAKNIRRSTKRPSCVPRALAEPIETITIPEDAIVDTKPEPKPATIENSQEDRPRPMSNVDLTIDLVAKGYFSEPEIISTEAKANSRLLKKLKHQEGRSQSEQNRGKRDRSPEGKKHSSSKKPKKLNSLEADFDKRKSKCKSKKLDSNESSVLTMTESKKASKGKQQPVSEPKEKKSKKESKHSKKNTKASKKRSTPAPIDTPVMEVVVPEVEVPKHLEEDIQSDHAEDNAAGNESTIDDRETDFDDATTMLVDDDLMSVDNNTMIHSLNNNNNSAIENKNALGMTAEVNDPLLAPSEHFTAQVDLAVPVENKLLQSNEDIMNEEEDEEDEEEIMLAKRYVKKGSLRQRASRSRSKSKSRKFCIKKRHRIRMATEVEEIIVPRKSTSAPRWSNGWTWEGHPFQGKVFLNSDDPPVLRTCYPAMRHSEGDIIRPRDCVLLRAGSKRAELPYVAKVAHLWENPEDGEMMMSLLWYYRPEHTEQGRQAVDGPDEVFASRHKDHNSVACIEDKCYVLTFSEYCRFRRILKGFEEGIEEQPSIVPPLRRENTRLPPPVVAPDLVMYCQRVYEFRLKRLLKTPS